MWCGDEACEDEIKAQAGGVTSRCNPNGRRTSIRRVRLLWKTSQTHGLLGQGILNSKYSDDSVKRGQTPFDRIFQILVKSLDIRK